MNSNPSLIRLWFLNTLITLPDECYVVVRKKKKPLKPYVKSVHMWGGTHF